MYSRVHARVFAFVLAVLVAAAVPPSLPARAETSPPFELAFPQETSKTEFGSTFGDYRSGGRRHKGNDLLAPRMTEIYAVADGIVIHIGTSRLSGRNIRIEHVDGWTSHYVHLNNDNPGTDDGDAPWTLTIAPGVGVGIEVEKGQLIGWVGDSGNAESTTPHTHFELRKDDRAINPHDILLEAYERDRDHEERLVTMVADAARARLGDIQVE
ncbi:MAG TPA: M23 family metallopeptidase [Acidimicrobiia bacterium]|nr:M23 family metallopeptidase [Acidimicrobiia bacterium]